MPSAQFTVRDAVFQVLRDTGVTTVFGNPGSTELAFLGEWPEDFKYILALQEASAVGMADGMSRVTGKPSFVSVHSAAGLGNCLGNLFTAYKNQVPVVVMAGQQERSLLSSEAYLAAADATTFPEPYIKWSVEPATATDVPAALARCIKIAMQPPCGPVFISVPDDDWDKPCEPFRIGRIAGPGEASEAELKQVADMLSKARRPALVAGSEIDAFDAYHCVVRLAECTGATAYTAPVTASAAFPEDHPQFGGFLPAIPEKLSEMLERHDAVIVVGAPVFTFHVGGTAAVLTSTDTRIMQITSDPDSASRARTELSLVGDLKASLDLLLHLLPGLPAPSIGAPFTLQRSTPDKGEGLPSADYVLSRLRALMPEDAILVEEAPSHRPAMQRNLPVTQQGGFYTMSSGGLGYGLPASVGIALAQNKRKVVALIGDGSMQYSIQALWTAAQHSLPLTVVVLNNCGYGALKSFSKIMGTANTPGMDLPMIDLARIAEGYGCHASRVDDVELLEEALKVALTDPHSHLVDISVDPEAGNVY
ncbi:benzoylformate decarboxylase [Escherichia coli]|nr:benzoylformate decarboxylase [Escherichia coli]EFN9649697.1 benzoylformate decarboxylase [Escherichia coli]EFN9723732.1 benzoylformate decarboxylase [Escherichia coli]EFN9733931.1 benzoylformate decarboxylase [Escherichia coli]EFN9743631.1 benzoylformate decarboxylase [Escherichia coli]